MSIFGAPKHAVGNRYHLAYIQGDKILVSEFCFGASRIARNRLETLRVIPRKTFTALLEMLPEEHKDNVHFVSDDVFFNGLGVTLQAGLDTIKSKPNGRKPTIPQDVIARIRADDVAGVPRREISKRYGIAQSTLSNIIRHSRRADTPGDTLLIPLSTPEGRSAARAYAEAIRAAQPEVADRVDTQLAKMEKR